MSLTFTVGGQSATLSRDQNLGDAHRYPHSDQIQFGKDNRPYGSYGTLNRGNNIVWTLRGSDTELTALKAFFLLFKGRTITVTGSVSLDIIVTNEDFETIQEAPGFCYGFSFILQAIEV